RRSLSLFGIVCFDNNMMKDGKFVIPHGYCDECIKGLLQRKDSEWYKFFLLRLPGQDLRCTAENCSNAQYPSLLKQLFNKKLLLESSLKISLNRIEYDSFTGWLEKKDFSYHDSFKGKRKYIM